MLTNVLPPRIPIKLGEKETYLQYNTFPSVWYLDHYGIETADIFTENNDLGQVLHLLRAGLIQANFAENKAIIDSGRIEDVKPTLSELAEIVTPEMIINLGDSILDGLVKSLPDVPLGETQKSKKKRTGLLIKLFGATFCTIRKKIFCKHLSKQLSKHLTNTQN